MHAADIDMHMKLIATVLANGTSLGGVKMARPKLFSKYCFLHRGFILWFFAVCFCLMFICLEMARPKKEKTRTAKDDVVDQLKTLASTHKLEDKSLELCEKSAYCAKMAANLKSLRIGLLLRFVSCVGTCRSSSSDNHITGL